MVYYENEHRVIDTIYLSLVVLHRVHTLERQWTKKSWMLGAESRGTEKLRYVCDECYNIYCFLSLLPTNL
jgi:hypothetical protein